MSVLGSPKGLKRYGRCPKMFEVKIAVEYKGSAR